jgi:hypothetical protein
LFWLGRVARGTVPRMGGRTPVCNGNVESWRGIFGKDAIVVWHFHSFTRKRQRMRRWQADPDMPPVLLLRTPKAVDEWLNSLPATGPSGGR